MISSDPNYLRHVFTHWGHFPYKQGWLLNTIREARNYHDAGFFPCSAALVVALWTDPRISSACELRSSTATKWPWEVTPSIADARSSARGLRSESEEARSARGAERVRALLHPQTGATTAPLRRHAREWTIMMGVAVDQIQWTPGEDEWAARVVPWPMACVEWDETEQSLMAITGDGRVKITHGDGKWIVRMPRRPEGWLRGALRCTALEWASRQIANRTANHEAEVHAMKLPIGEMGENQKTKDPEGDAFAELVKKVRDGRGTGIHPHGAKIYSFDPGGDGHDIIDMILGRDNSDIVIAILGQDGTTQKGDKVYTAPVFDKVRDDLTDSDVDDDDEAIQSGLVVPFVTLNFGADVIPTARQCYPRGDARAAAQAAIERRKAHAAQLAADREAGIVVDQPHSDRVAQDFGMREPFPRVGPGPALPDTV